MFKIYKYFIIFLIFNLFNLNIAFAEKYEDVKKLYDLYSQNILDDNQLNSSLEKMNLNNENIKNLISLRKEGIISEDDFINGVKMVIEKISISKNKLKETENNIIENKLNKYEFQTELNIIHAYVNSDFKYGEIWSHMFILVDDKISQISLKDSKNNDLIKFSKPRIKFLKDKKFTIRSNAYYIPEPSVSIRYDFKGTFEDNKIIGEVEITYTGTDGMGTVLLKAKTK